MILHLYKHRKSLRPIKRINSKLSQSQPIPRIPAAAFQPIQALFFNQVAKVAGGGGFGGAGNADVFFSA